MNNDWRLIRQNIRGRGREKRYRVLRQNGLDRFMKVPNMAQIRDTVSEETTPFPTWQLYNVLSVVDTRVDPVAFAKPCASCWGFQG